MTGDGTAGGGHQATATALSAVKQITQGVEAGGNPVAYAEFLGDLLLFAHERAQAAGVGMPAAVGSGKVEMPGWGTEA